MRIKVCHLASGDLWAGAEVQVVNMCRGLLETDRVQVNAVVLNEGRLVEELRSLGLAVTVIDERKIHWWQILQQLTTYFKGRSIDILHTHRYKENVLGSVAAERGGIPRVVRTVHGITEIHSGWKGVKRRAYKELDDVVCHYFVDGLIGVSLEIADDLRRRFSGKTVRYIPNCVDERRLVPSVRRKDKRVELGLRPCEFVIGTVGRLTPVKGTKYLIRAVPEIIKRHEDVRVLVVGDGPLRGGLEGLVRSLGLEKTITFLGWRNDTIEIINALDLFVLPSLHEGMPTVLLEAMALGIPVVASSSGGVPEFVTNGRNGLLTKPGSELRLAEACLSVISDPSLAKRVSLNARHDTRRYHVYETASHILSLYKWLQNGTN